MANVKITITVNMDALLQLLPNGGEIPDGDIVVMEQKGGDFDYETGTKAKLITKAALGTKIKWKIKSNNSTNLDLVSYDGDDQATDIFEVLPAVDPANADEFDASVKSQQPTKNYSSAYTFSFCDKKNPTVVWKWDPHIDYPFPPV